MGLVDQMLWWLLRQRGYEPASALPPETQREIADARRAAERLARRLAEIDAMAVGLGVMPDAPERRERRHA